MDKIHLNNGIIIDGTVTQIGIETVTIKYGAKDLTRTLHKDAIKVIIYEDGTAETFPQRPPVPTTPSPTNNPAGLKAPISVCSPSWIPLMEEIKTLIFDSVISLFSQ